MCGQRPEPGGDCGLAVHDPRLLLDKAGDWLQQSQGEGFRSTHAVRTRPKDQLSMQSSPSECFLHFGVQTEGRSMRLCYLMLLALTPLPVILGCAGMRTATGQAEVLVPLQVPVDSAAQCYVAGWEYVPSTGRRQPSSSTTRWYRKTMMRALDEEKIFAGTASRADGERYWVTCIVESTAVGIDRRRRDPTPALHVPRAQGQPRRTAQPSYYESAVEYPTVVLISLVDETTDKTLFMVRIKHCDYRERFAALLGAAVRELRSSGP